MFLSADRQLLKKLLHTAEYSTHKYELERGCEVSHRGQAIRLKGKESD